MENNRPLILITNDDGYSSKGITELIAMAQRIGDVVVVAPDTAQSGMSHAITFSSYVRVKTIKEEPQLKVYAVIIRIKVIFLWKPLLPAAPGLTWSRFSFLS